MNARHPTPEDGEDVIVQLPNVYEKANGDYDIVTVEYP